MKHPPQPAPSSPPSPGEEEEVHRALLSLVEELQAVDWYGRRVAECKDEALREVLSHNQHEEIEHAMMLLEWLRLKHPVFAAQARARLFTDGVPRERAPS